MIDIHGKPRSGGRVLVDALRGHGVSHAFCVPGESYLPVLDALHDTAEIALTVCRHESGAAMMAEALGKLTGEPGVCLVTRGPGATNASPGVHIAYQDSTPLVLLVGQVARGELEREAFQEIDYRGMFGQMAKWVAQVDSASRIPELVSHAFHTAVNGRPGPVVLALPQDVLEESTDAADAAHFVRATAWPSPRDIERFAALLREARQPVVIAGGGGWSASATKWLQQFAASFDLPVVAAFRRQDCLDNTHPCYAGDCGIGINPRLAQRVRDADLLIVVGARLGEMTTGGYSLVNAPTPSQRLVHVHPGAEELGRVYRAELPVNASPAAFLEACASLAPEGAVAWGEWRSAGRSDYEQWNAIPDRLRGIDVAWVVGWLADNLAHDTIVTNDAGNFSAWLHRYFRYRDYGTQLAPTSGSMGYAVPAAVAAKRLHPGREVVAFTGDGSFMMTGQELATAMQFDARIIIIVVNNAMYGTIRMHQERRYPGRVTGTQLRNPDFALLARSHGAHGELVERNEDFPAAFLRAREADCPALIELRVDPEAITPRETLSAIRQSADRTT